MATGVLAAAGVAAFAKSTLDIGKAYQSTLNNLQAVSGASASQMDAVGKRAKALGSDLTLTSTSAADAATAMTELAKGGLTVDEAMAAAKGTLQLASAAGIDAAQAAVIQSAALNAYSLEADQAGRVSDVLANAANAAAGEISDFAQGMAQASAVAAATGISLEDTAATLGILANNGIAGSDAGTLLKSALLALQSPSGPAQKAMDALSLSAYDATGNFVGLSSIFGQLQAAQKAMTPEAYAAATSTLFGSDAARLAGIAGKEGAAGFDAMREAMGREGAAADVAAAKAKGVGGAIEAFQSQVETFQIDLFERASPNLEKLIRYAAEKLPSIGDAVLKAADKGIEWIGKLKDEAVADFQAIRTYLQPITSQFGAFFSGLGDGQGPLSAVTGLLKTIKGVIGDVAGAVEPLVAAAGALLGFFNGLPGPMQTVILAFLALKAAAKFDLLGGLAGRGGVTGGVAGGLRTMGTSVQGFTQTVRTNMRLAEDSVGRVGRVTGGLSAGIQTTFPNATRQLGLFSASMRSAADQARQLQRYNVTQMGGIPSRSTGDVAAFGAAARVAATTGVAALRTAAGGLTNLLGGPFGVTMIAATVLVGSISSTMRKAKAQTDEWSTALMDGGAAASKVAAEAQRIRDKQPFDWMADLDEWSGAAPSMDKAAAAAKKAYDALTPLGKAEQDVTRETNDLIEANDKYGEFSPQAAAASNNLRSAQLNLSNQQAVLADATKSATTKLQEQRDTILASSNADLAASMAQTSLEQAFQTTAATVAEYGATSLEGRQATDQLTQAAMSAAQAAADQASAHSLAADDEGKQMDADAALLASLQATATQLGVNTPKAITDLIASLGSSSKAAGTTADKMGALGLSVVSIPNSKSVIIDAPTADQEKRLGDLGYKVTHLPNGQVRVDADTGPAETSIAALLGRTRTLALNIPVGAGTGGGGGTAKRQATGGPVIGPGTATSDSIATYLSNGEYVIKARSVAKYGQSFFDSVNAGRFASGGLVGTAARQASVYDPSLEPARIDRVYTPTRRTRSGVADVAPLIGGDLVLQADPTASVHDQMETVMHELRRLRRGGR